MTASSLNYITERESWITHNVLFTVIVLGITVGSGYEVETEPRTEERSLPDLLSLNSTVSMFSVVMSTTIICCSNAILLVLRSGIINRSNI